MKHSELHRYIMQRKQLLRSQLVPNPNDETLNLWRLDEQKDQWTLDRYLREEAAEEASASSEPSYNVNFTSNVRIKR